LKIPDFILDGFTWSFSRINGFASSCPYAWYLQYVECRNGENNSFGEYGTFVHEILEKYAKDELAIFELSDYYKENFDANIPHRFPKNKYVSLYESYFNAGLEYFNDYFEGFDDYKILGVEKEVRFKLEDKYNFVGYIDLLLQDENGDLIVYDHKSKGGFKSKKEIKEYARQLYLYSIPVINEYKKMPKKLIFNMFKKHEIVEVEFTGEGLEEAKKWAVDTIHSIENCEDFPPKKDQFFCSNICNFRSTCGALLE
jgi:CRISPR/Cas system-associated exonuclease Cas4 (RecB family)